MPSRRAARRLSKASRTQLLDSEDDLLLVLSDLGAKAWRMEVARAGDDQRFARLEEQVSNDADIDFAAAIVKLKQTQTAYQAAMQSGARILDRSLLDFI